MEEEKIPLEGAGDGTEEAKGTEALEGQEKENQEEQQEEEEPQESQDDSYEKLFTVNFNINAEELYQFQIRMAGDQIEKNKKRSKLVSVIEIGLGLVYLIAMLMGKGPKSMIQVALIVAIIGMGIYGLVYYKYFFYQSLRKSVEKQHDRASYFKSDIALDIYPNRCVERFGEQETPNYWHNMLGVINTPDAYYIRLDDKHCLLVPKRCAGEELEPFLRKICGDFEKEWRETA